MSSVVTANRDGDVESAAELGARRAFAAISHELASPLTALNTFLRLATGDGLAPIKRCAERIQAIAELARELAFLDEAASGSRAVSCDLVLAVESAAARIAVAVELAANGEHVVIVPPTRAQTIATAVLRAVVLAATAQRFIARVERRGDRIWMRIDPGIEPAEWRVVEPWRSGTGFKLELWAAAVAARDGEVRVGEQDGQIAVEVELPAAEPR